MDGSPLTFSSVLSHLDAVAEDRIRDGKQAKNALSSLMRVVRMAMEGDSIVGSSPSSSSLASSAAAPFAPAALPIEAILGRLCYFANARDTAIRSAALRAARYVSIDRAAIAIVCRSRLVLSIVRSLEREQRYLWERIQALKLVKVMMERAPEILPMVILRSLVAIASYVAAPSGAATASSQAGNPTSKQGTGNAAAAAAAVGGNHAAGAPPTSTSSAASPSSPTHAISVDNMRRVALETLRTACHDVRLLPALKAAGVFPVLLDAAIVGAQTASDLDLSVQIICTLSGVCSDPASRRYLGPSDVMQTILSPFSAAAASGSAGGFQFPPDAVGGGDAEKGPLANAAAAAAGGAAAAAAAPMTTTAAAASANKQRGGKSVSANSNESISPITRQALAGTRHLFVTFCRSWVVRCS
jgi:hypothetical protein